MTRTLRNVITCINLGEGLCRSLATPDPFVLTNKICLNQHVLMDIVKLLQTWLIENEVGVMI